MSLTSSVLMQGGPKMLETAIKHYLNKKAVKGGAREEFLFDEAFVLVKTFLEISSRHTADDLQKFSLTKTPSPPGVLTHRVLIPLSSCSRAAELLIRALGGDEQALKIAGGTKWWTVRMQAGVEGEWIGIKEDFRREERRREKVREMGRKGKGKVEALGVGGKRQETVDGVETEGEEESQAGEFTEEMDHLRCMLYIHGGAYYWGSINTHRYTIWRYARKMHGRCFAVNYRKAPQFPFPCALQDCIAAYLYLLYPPEGSKHRAIDPRNLIIAGDSAGGGLVLALLQVIRDIGLPAPAGAVLISPWSDLTHSFPSILTNTTTDIIPPYGFIHKPSSLWPPPPPALTEKVQEGLRERVKQAVHRLAQKGELPAEMGKDADANDVGEGVTAMTETKTTMQLNETEEEVTARGDTRIGDLVKEHQKHQHEESLESPKSTDPEHHPGPTHPSDHPAWDDPTKDPHHLTLTVDGKEIVIRSQIQLYCTNAQLAHPYVSPALGCLAGLPPLLIIVSDKEVLRDEILYVAHKAAHPEKYPVKEEVAKLLPSLQKDRGYKPTNVHLQVYDNTCHVLPLFSMCEPAKHAYRSIANFCRYATKAQRTSSSVFTQAHVEHAAERQSSEPAHPDPTTLVSLPVPTTSKTAPPTLDLPHESGTPPPEAKLFTLTTTSPLGTPTRSGSPAPMDVEPSPIEPLPTADHHLVLQRQLLEVKSSAPSPITTSTSSSRKSTFRQSLSTAAAAPFLFAGSLTRKLSYQDRPDTSSDLGSPTDYHSDASASGANTPPLSASAHQSSIASEEERYAFPSDEIKVPKDIPLGGAGNSEIYAQKDGKGPFVEFMIRERVSGKGVCRVLEHESELEGIHMPLEEVGVIKEGPALRYLNGQQIWDERYKHTSKKIAKRREEHLKRSQAEAATAVVAWKSFVDRKRADHGKAALGNPAGAKGAEGEKEGGGEKEFDEAAYLFDNEFSWTWALKGERPPPTAIIARRDTSESRMLASQADRMVDPSLHFGGLSLWTAMAGFFSKESGSEESSKKSTTSTSSSSTGEAAGSGSGFGKVFGGGGGKSKSK